MGLYTYFPLVEALKTIDIDRLNELETIDPHPIPPWRTDMFSEIELECDREISQERVDSIRNISNIIIYLDTSRYKDYLGIAIIILNSNKEIVESKQI